MTRKKKPAPSKRLVENLKKSAAQYLTARGFRNPMTPLEILDRLSLPHEHQEALEVGLQDLVNDGLLFFSGKSYELASEEQNDLLQGTIRVHHRGFGFFVPSTPTEYQQDIFIPKHLTMNAMDGDTVEVEVAPGPVSEKGPEGKVIAILERSRSHIAGIVKQVGSDGEALVYAPLLGPKRRVVVQKDSGTPLIRGDRIVMSVTEWGGEEEDTVCKLSHKIGHIDDPSSDIPAAIEEYELHHDFSAAALDEARSYGNSVPLKEVKQRDDFRDLPTITIDPSTAKDFDDALTVIKKKNGYHLRVHIADVSFYVKPGTSLDQDGRVRCNSTYFPGFCLPMLPPSLSDNLCSLKPKVNRLTLSVIMDLDAAGTVTNYRIAKGVIRSDKRFSYREAKEVLDGKKSSPHKKMLEHMVELCHLLKKKRYERGSIEFGLPEVRIQVDDEGAPYGTELIEYDITHQLVEEFMLKANETIAQHLSNEEKHLPFRIHEQPSEENLGDFVSIAAAFGYDLSASPTVQELQKLFDEAIDATHGPYLASTFIRSMKQALYSPDNIGHYGLALTHYCHFTSPIRRYVDLVVHRQLFESNHTYEEITEVSKKCSEQERISARAENSVLLLKKLRLLKDLKEEEPDRIFDAIVTRVKPFGFSFDMVDLMMDGFFHVSKLGDDYYRYNPATMSLEGTYTEDSFHPGDVVEVMLKEIDLITLETEWELVSVFHDKDIPKKRDERKKKKRKKKKRSR